MLLCIAPVTLCGGHGSGVGMHAHQPDTTTSDGLRGTYVVMAQKRSMLSPSPVEEDVETLLAQSSAARALGPPPAAARPSVAPGGPPAAAAPGGGRGRWGQRLTLAPQLSAWGRKSAELAEDEEAAAPGGKMLSGSYSPEDGASLKRARSAEAESPPTTQLYALRSRACPHRSPPGFGTCPDPEAAAAAERAASATQGPIKSRLKVPSPDP